uniref:Transmembrane protein n=1 Tax=Ditylenchus dipsaci TaxID=166011 RepID=A0A915E2I8_9BILA
MSSMEPSVEAQPIKDFAAPTKQRTKLQVVLLMYAVCEFILRVCISFTFVQSYQIQISCLSTIFPILLLLAVAYEKKSLFVIYLIYNGFYIACYWLQTGLFIYLAAELPADYVKLLIVKQDFLDDQWDVQIYFITMSVGSALLAVGLHIVRRAIRSVIAQMDNTKQEKNVAVVVDNTLPQKNENIVFAA